MTIKDGAQHLGVSWDVFKDIHPDKSAKALCPACTTPPTSPQVVPLPRKVPQHPEQYLLAVTEEMVGALDDPDLRQRLPEGRLA